ncbi:MAG TPA: radical SAM protein [Deltaproteobacteria bacterium]|nr:radical SAM protein [Deltaproteobacteria bacterium]
MGTGTGQGWHYVVEQDQDAVPVDQRIVTRGGRILTRRPHGHAGRIEVVDRVGLPVAAGLRASAAVGAIVGEQRVRVVIDFRGTRITDEALHLDPQLVTAPTRFPLEAALSALGPIPERRHEPRLPDHPVPRALFFESLMSSELPHNDTELSQGVLYLISALSGINTEVVLADVKMPIQGSSRPTQGLERLEAALSGGPIGLICITLLEGYWHGVVQLIATLRRLGCRGHVAVGGVMPSLAPEHVAAHLPGISFACRGAGEVFVPALARILGDGDIDTPLTEEQRSALLQLDGLIAVDQAGGVLISARSSRTVAVPELDTIALDPSLLTERHLQGGIELSTSRGCIHRCTFCSILGRQAYQARSAESVLALLERYEAHFHSLWGEAVPAWAYRVHISDDDFACDRQRARALLPALLRTPFRLSSVQVSVADLCRRQGHRLLPEVDEGLLDAFDPACFADHGEILHEDDWIEDHRSRSWSSFLQIGVETYCDAELARLGKGYRVAHIRAVVAALAARGLHMDGYFILANTDTTATELIEVLDEVARLKIQHPRWFHVRFPIVPRLVSYFTSASFRRLVRTDREHTLALRDRARIEGYPEYDYPFVDHDRPEDPWVDDLDGTFFTDAGLYTGALVALRARWLERHRGLAPGAQRDRGARLLRRLDDRPRRLVFSLLADALRRTRAAPGPAAPPEVDADQVLASAERVLGPRSSWLKAFRRYTSDEVPRMVVIPTWQCELRCGYCFIPKQGGREMRPETLQAAIELLMASDRGQLILQFFGGEALLRWPLVQLGITEGARRAKEEGKRLRFIVSSNGLSLDAEKLSWLAEHEVKLELSLDGDRRTQNLQRPAVARGLDSYDRGIAHRAELIRSSGLEHEVIMVVHPRLVTALPHNFFHIVDLGFPRVQINFALGFLWSPEQQRALAEGLFAVGRELRRRWGAGEAVSMVNLESEPIPVRLNGELTVDWDGTLYGGNAFLHETEHKDRFVVGHLDELGSFDRYWMDAPSNEALLAYSYPAPITENNLEVGRLVRSFIRWMRLEGLGPGRATPSPT